MIVVKDAATLEQLKAEFKDKFYQAINQVVSAEKAAFDEKEKAKKEILEKKLLATLKNVKKGTNEKTATIKPQFTQEDYEFLKEINTQFSS